MIFFLLNILSKDTLFNYSLYLSMLMFYVSNYKPIHKPQVLDNQELNYLNEILMHLGI